MRRSFTMRATCRLRRNACTRLRARSTATIALSRVRRAASVTSEALARKRRCSLIASFMIRRKQAHAQGPPQLFAPALARFGPYPGCGDNEGQDQQEKERSVEVREPLRPQAPVEKLSHLALESATDRLGLYCLWRHRVADRKGASLVVYVVDDDASIRGSLALMHIMEKLKVRNIAELVRFAFHPRHPSFIGD